MSRIIRALLVIAICHASNAIADGGLSPVRQIAAGLIHTCAIVGDGKVACWGNNSSGQLGNGTYASHARPVYVKMSSTDYLGDAVQVAVGADFSCALRSSGSVYCWGNNDIGELGNGETGKTEPYPVRVLTSSSVRAISAMGESSCALLDNLQRSIRCWGNNYDGQLGDGTKTNRAVPVDVVITERDGTRNVLTGISQVSIGSDHACAVLDDTSAACWGFNWVGELGNGTYVDNVSPTAVVKLGTPKLYDIEQISANGLHTCAKFASTWQLTCWGNNTDGALGVPSVELDTPFPADVPVGARTVYAGEASTCAMLADARVACWGSNYYAQLGNGTTTSSRTPVILSLPKISQLSVGANHACVVMPDATAMCWGAGGYGQIGDARSAGINPSPRLVLEP